MTSLAARNANATTPASISVVATAGCGGFAVGTTNSTTVTLLNAPAPTRVLPVTLRVLAPTPLTALPTSAAMSYVKGSGTAGKADVLIGASSGTPFFTVDTTTLPIWLTVDSVNGSAPRSLRFSSTTVADTLAAGTYSATVRLRVANFGDLSLPVSLSVNNPAPKLTVSEGTTRTSLKPTLNEGRPASPSFVGLETRPRASVTPTKTLGIMASVIGKVIGVAVPFRRRRWWDKTPSRSTVTQASASG